MAESLNVANRHCPQTPSRKAYQDSAKKMRIHPCEQVRYKEYKSYKKIFGGLLHSMGRGYVVRDDVDTMRVSSKHASGSCDSPAAQGQTKGPD